MNVGVAEWFTVCQCIGGAYFSVFVVLRLPSEPTNALHLDSVTWVSAPWPVRVLTEVLLRTFTNHCRAGCETCQ